MPKYKTIKYEGVDIKIPLSEHGNYHPRQTILFPKNDVIWVFESLFPSFVEDIKRYKGKLYSYPVSFRCLDDWFMDWNSRIDLKSFITKTQILIEKKGLNWFDNSFNRDLLFERFNTFFWEAKIICFLYYDSFHTKDERLLTFIKESRSLPLLLDEKRQLEKISPFFKNFFKKNAGDILPIIEKKALSFLNSKTMSEWCEEEIRRSNVEDKEIEEYIRVFKQVLTCDDFPRLPDPLKTPEIEEFLVEKRRENKKQYDEFCFREEKKRELKELAQKESTSQKELDEEMHNLSKNIKQTLEPKVGKYYKFLGIEKEDFKITTSIDYYLKNRKKSVLAADVLESFSVLSHPDLKKIYDFFVKEDSENDFFCLIGSQFYLFYDFCINEGLWKGLEEKEYYLEKSLSEKVLEIAKKLEELGRKNKGFFVDEEGKLTKDAFNIFTECYLLEKDSIYESIRDKYREESRFEEEIRAVSLHLFNLITLRENFIFVNLCKQASSACGMFASLRIFASTDPLDHLEIFSKILSEVENKDKLDHLLLIFEKFVLKARELAEVYNEDKHKGEFHLLCSVKYFSLSFHSIRHFSDKQKEENNYRKVWKDVCDFLETYEKRFLESSSLPSFSGKVDTSKIVVRDERGTFFKDRLGANSLFLILVIILSGFLKWWFRL